MRSTPINGRSRPAAPGHSERGRDPVGDRRPYSGYHRTIWSKAAALTHSLVTNHGFADGNKRTALLLVHLLVERSGWTFDPGTENLIDDMLVEVARGRLRAADVEDWYRRRLVRVRGCHRRSVRVE